MKLALADLQKSAQMEIAWELCQLTLVVGYSTCGATVRCGNFLRNKSYILPHIQDGLSTALTLFPFDVPDY